ncbi:MAG: nucleotidyltransferase family protein [Erysipelotrichaceae bacterium]|nr:nucleotidyltransferase family protein [Erysipelotrichaceae bacterium]
MKEMTAAGIIVEYNPLHNGHLHHLEETRRLTGCEIVVACMSGNMVQRGEFAVIDKWARAKAAVRAGVDMVIELPAAFVLQSATQFGREAVSQLALAECDWLVFGSETNNLAELQEISQMSFNIDNFRENMKQGFSYPASYGFMADSYGPNDILAISYLRAMQDHSSITPISIKRTSGYHDVSLDTSSPSAKAIRNARLHGTDISDFTPMAEELKGYTSPTWQQFYPYLRTLLMTMPRQLLQQIFLMDEGIEKHLALQAAEFPDYESFINAAVTRRYTRSRIQRTLCHLLLQNYRQEVTSLPPYDRIRPLAYNEKGRRYMRLLQEKEVIIVNHFTQNIKPYREMEYRAAVVYGMLMDDKHRHDVVRGEIIGPYTEKDS